MTLWVISGILVALIAAALTVYSWGRQRERGKTAMRGLENAEEAREVEDRVRRMSRDDMVKRMRKYLRK